MGCAQSKIENEEAVTRCKERKKWMKDAVSSRNAFAAAHSAYAVSLKNTGAALSDYAEGEVPTPGHHSSTTAAAAGSASSSSAAPTVGAVAIQPPMEKLPPPPPPLPDYPPPPLQRSASLPELRMPKLKKKAPAGASIREEEDDEDTAAAADDVPSTPPAAPAVSDASPGPPPPLPSQPQRSTTPPPPPAPDPKGLGPWDYFFGAEENMPPPTLSQPEETWPAAERREIEEEKIKTPATPLPPPAVGNDIRGVEPPVAPEKVIAEPVPPKAVKKMKQVGSAHHHALSAGASESKRGKMVAASVPPVNLLQILKELDDHFLKASESAHEVSKMLEATRMHYHSNFADNRGHIDHSAKVMRVITWNRSIKGMREPDDGKDDFDNDAWETHATILDKMLAWEKKLYDEVKAGEFMKIEYQRKVALLNKQKKRGVNSEALEKTKSAVSHLHTRYIVDMQSMDSTVSEINRLRDEKLYPKLVDLVDGMAEMWGTMHVHHGTQHKIVTSLRAFDISVAPKETSEAHHEITVQLWQIVREWHSQFEKLIKNQKDYIRSLNSWLRLNLIPIESSLKEKVSSPPRPSRPPIQPLLHIWNDQLEKLPDELAKSAIFSFSEVVRTIVVHQQDELKMKEKCKDMRKEFERKSRAFADWYRKYAEKRAASGEEANPEGGEGSHQDRVAERKLEVDALESSLKEEEEAYTKLCKHVREKSLASLRTHLPELFRGISEFALACSEMYKKLSSVTTEQ